MPSTLCRARAVFALRNLSIRQAAAIMGVSRTHLSETLDGRRKASAEMAAKLEALLGRKSLAFISGAVTQLDITDLVRN